MDEGMKTLQWWKLKLGKLTNDQVRVLATKARDTGLRPFMRDPYVMIVIRNEARVRGVHADK